MASSVHHDTAAVAGTGLDPSRRRPLSRGRLLRGAVPYALILPVVAAIGAILGYPLYNLVRLSFERYGLAELIQRSGTWIGLANYALSSTTPSSGTPCCARSCSRSRTSG